MIIKGRSRGRAAELAAHLLRKDENESIRVHEYRGVVAQTVPASLAEMEALGAGVRSRKPLYHASISAAKATPLTDAQISEAVDALGARLGLKDQPRVVVVHEKLGRKHVHVVWSRVDLANGKTVSDSWNYARHEQVARALEQSFGHEHVQGAHTRRQGKKRPKRTPKEYELRQEKRSGIPRADITAELTALWRSAKSGAGFREAIERAGYVLARGDRRDVVVLDRGGEVHSLARRIDGVRANDLREKFCDIRLETLPSAATARSTFRSRQTTEAVRIQQQSAAVLSKTPRLNDRSRPYRIRTWQPSSFHRPSNALAHFYAAKIAAAYLYAPRHEIAAMVSVLRAERQAAFDALSASEPQERENYREAHPSHSFRWAMKKLTRRRICRHAPARRRTWLRATESARKPSRGI